MKIEYFGIIQVLFISCVDPISFETASESGHLVFYGEFTQMEENQTFTIARTSEFGKPNIPVSGATIDIEDDLGNTAVYAEIENGKYSLGANEFQGVPGRFYHVDITLEDGRNYLSTPQKMPEPVEIDDIFFRVESQQVLGGSGIIVDQNYINIYINTSLSNQGVGTGGLRWSVDEAYSFTDLPCHPFFDASTTCYFKIPADDSSIKIFSTEGEVQQYLNGYKVQSRILAPDDEFLERHYFSVYQYTISPETYEYWEKVRIVANQTGDLLDRPAAQIPGNIYEKDNPNNRPLGYFEVSGKNVRRIFTLPYLIGDNLILETCPPERNTIIQDKCCFCYLLDEERNRIERPEYWSD